MIFDVDKIRARFPSLSMNDDGRQRVFLDGPGGTQVPQCVLNRMQDYLIRSNSNVGGSFRTSVSTDNLLLETRAAMADFINAPLPSEIVFGSNMTTLTFSLSRALGHWMQPGDEIIITHLDHDANVVPWIQLAQDRNLVIRWLDFHPNDCTLRMDRYESLLSSKTRLVAVGYASNAVGTINPVREMADMAHGAGALVFVDAVQYMPHGPTDVEALSADFLVCSAYKFFGPHLGALWGRSELLNQLPAYNVRPAGDQSPDKFETGTQSYEAIAGTLGALEHIEWVGQQFGDAFTSEFPEFTDRRLNLHIGMAAIKAYEHGLSAHLTSGLDHLTGVKVWGITDPSRFRYRVPTVSFTIEGIHPRAVTDRLAENNIFVWDGHNYAVEIMEQLGMASTGGMVRVGSVHYNHTDELDCMLDIVAQLAG